MKQELEKEILEEIGMKEGDKLTYEGTKKVIQLTQSKIIERIDNKHIIVFAILHHAHLPKSLCLAIESEVLQSLKKDLLEPEKEEKLGCQVATENVDPNSSSENSKGEKVK